MLQLPTGREASVPQECTEHFHARPGRGAAGCRELRKCFSLAHPLIISWRLDSLLRWLQSIQGGVEHRHYNHGEHGAEGEAKHDGNCHANPEHIL